LLDPDANRSIRISNGTLDVYVGRPGRLASNKPPLALDRRLNGLRDAIAQRYALGQKQRSE
jgi:hypothetical protein